ncbi:uncharacterized protein LOC127102149 [Lathyrus oleraceus]|uniref:uncharacterized protein LOC127102149 n=1 Tax=Pisum sativum TaxID=3888 RepID=UPI0021D16E1C|nr:uncharacterized protein LOC127102149 [Pisum sativum]
MEYTTKFEELSKFFPHYNGVEVGGSKCIKFESGLRPEIKQFIGYQKILQFSILVNKCHIYDEDNRAKFIHYKSVSNKRNGNQKCRKLYVVLDGKECTAILYFKCMKAGDRVVECKGVVMVYFNCGEIDHISTQFQKPMKTQDVKFSGKVFTLSGAEASKSDSLI